MAEHILVTGPIHGPIPIQHKDYPDGLVDVTENQMVFTNKATMLAVAKAIEVAHKARKTGPYTPPED